MAEYDFKSAKRYIQIHSDIIESASLGMLEDWWWTAETVYEDGKFTKDLGADGVEVGGITGSLWATPTLEIEFKCGATVTKDCYIGEITDQKPDWFSLGCISQEVQDMRDGKYIDGPEPS